MAAALPMLGKAASFIPKALPIVGSIFKGIKDIFGGGKKKQVEQQQQYGPQTAQESFGQSVGNFGNAARGAFDAFRQGGFRGGMGHMMDHGFNDMYSAGRDMYNSGRGVYQNARGAYDMARGGDYEGSINKGFGMIDGFKNGMMRRRLLVA